MWTIIGQRTVIVIIDIAGRRCCQGYHRVGIGRPVDVKGLLQSVDDGGRAKWRGAGVVADAESDLDLCTTSGFAKRMLLRSLDLLRPNTLHFLIFSGVLSPHSSHANYIRNGYRWCAVTRKPGSVWLEGTPAMDLGHMNVVLKSVDVFVCWKWSVELEWLLLLTVSVFLSFLGFENPTQSPDQPNNVNLNVFVGLIVCVFAVFF